MEEHARSGREQGKEFKIAKEGMRIKHKTQYEKKRSEKWTKTKKKKKKMSVMKVRSHWVSVIIMWKGVRFEHL